MGLELSILGRSIGEAVVIRFGERLRHTILIDSFISRGRPASLHYLKHSEADPSSIVVVAASHWDSDHTDGLADILRAADAKTRFVYPYVVDVDRLVRLAVTARVAAVDGRRRGGDAFAEILAVARERHQHIDALRSKDTLWQDHQIHIRALSPTSSAVNAGLASVGRELIVEPSKRTAACAVKPNLTSMALWVETATHRALLGADLEAHSQYGWQAAISDSQTIHLGGPAQVLKVPHHGSVDADHDAMWNELLTHNPHAAVTPYAPSKRPRLSDLRRLQSKPCALRIAASPHWAGWNEAAQINPELLPLEVGKQRGVGVVTYEAAAAGEWRVTTLTL